MYFIVPFKRHNALKKGVNSVLDKLEKLVFLITCTNLSI